MANCFMWDYNYPEYKFQYDPFEMQKDWNQTLVTQFNLINASLHAAEIVKSKIINVPEKFRSLIESLEYFNPEKQMLSSNYIIKFVKREGNCRYIDVQGVPLKIENFNTEIE